MILAFAFSSWLKDKRTSRARSDAARRLAMEQSLQNRDRGRVVAVDELDLETNANLKYAALSFTILLQNDLIRSDPKTV